MPHWTSANDEAFIHRIAFDFITQLEKRIEASGVTQSELARRLSVTDGAVSQVLNNQRDNINLKTMVSYAQALGMKVAVIAYDDLDPQNEHGPIGSEIFTSCWERAGRPVDVWSVNDGFQTAATNHPLMVGYSPGYILTLGLNTRSVSSTLKGDDTSRQWSAGYIPGLDKIVMAGVIHA